MATIIRCDGCGRDKVGHENLIVTFRRYIHPGQTLPDMEEERFDLCNVCIGRFILDHLPNKWPIAQEAM